MKYQFKTNALYIRTLLALALKRIRLHQNTFIAIGFFMFVQNMIMFMIWVVFFAHFSSLGGWQLADVATLYGLAAFAYGLAGLVCGGVLDIGRTIVSGELDTYLGQPRHPLIALMLRENRAYGLGDMATAPVLWFFYSSPSPLEWVLLLVLGLFSAVILLSAMLAINTLPFFLTQASRLTDLLVESFTMIAVYPHHGFGPLAKGLVLTLFPAGFIAYIPVYALRDMNVFLMGAMALAALFYMTVAVVLFNAGVQRYLIGNTPR